MLFLPPCLLHGQLPAPYLECPPYGAPLIKQQDPHILLIPQLCSCITFSLKSSLVLFPVSSHSYHSIDFIPLYLLEFGTYSFDCTNYTKLLLLVCLHGGSPYSLSSLMEKAFLLLCVSQHLHDWCTRCLLKQSQESSLHHPNWWLFRPNLNDFSYRALTLFWGNPNHVQIIEIIRKVFLSLNPNILPFNVHPLILSLPWRTYKSSCSLFNTVALLKGWPSLSNTFLLPPPPLITHQVKTFFSSSD